MNYVADKAWEIFPVPLLMTDMEVRVQFYVKRQNQDDEKLRHVEIYRYLDMELRRIVDMMEAHPEKYMQVV